jgi:hypothetical protein
MSPLSSATPVNLSAEGDLDWAHYGSFGALDYDHKAGVTEQIGNPTHTGPILQFTGSAALCSWVDGTVDQAMTIDSGNFIYNTGSAYQWNIPASTTPVVLHLYLSTYLGGGDLTFTLSDASAPAVVTSIPAGTAQRVSVTFAANSAAQTLTVDYVVPSGSGNNIALMAASLSSAAALPLSVAAPQLSCTNTTVPTGSTFSILANPTGVAANGATAFAYQWQANNGGGYVNIGGGTSNPLRVTAGSAGSYNYRVIVTNSVLGGAAVTSAPVALTVTTPTGTLGVNSQVVPGSIPPIFTLPEANLTTEGATDWAHWGIGGILNYKNGMIGNYTQIGVDSSLTALSGVGFTWTDSTGPNPTATQTTDAIGMLVNNGFLLNIPAATTNQMAYIYVGLNKARAHIEFTLSDNTAPLFTDNPTITDGVVRYAIVFSAATTGKTLEVKITETARAGNNGTVSLLAAAVAPVPALSVASPIASPSTSVLVNQPMVVSLAPFQPVGAPPFTYVWQRDATGSGSSYVNQPETGTSTSFNARSTPGTELCRVIATGSQGSVTSAPVVLTVSPVTGTIVVSRTAIPNGSTIDLTSEGIIDWKHWGFGGVAGVDRKATGGGLISDYISIGPGIPASSTPPVTYIWSDGTPNTSASHTGGIKAVGAGNGFEITVPAASYERVLNLYNTLNSATMHFEASMNDGSAYAYSNDSWSGSGNNTSRWQVRFANSTPGTFLRVRFWDLTGVQVVLNSATLVYGDIKVQVEPVSGGQVMVTWPVGTLLEAPSVTGPWTTNVATSPYTFTPTASQKFFRAIIQ